MIFPFFRKIRFRFKFERRTRSHEEQVRSLEPRSLEPRKFGTSKFGTAAGSKVSPLLPCWLSSVHPLVYFSSRVALAWRFASANPTERGETRDFLFLFKFLAEREREEEEEGERKKRDEKRKRERTRQRRRRRRRYQ